MEIKQKMGSVSKAQLFNMSKGTGCTLLKNVEEGTVFKVKSAVIMTDYKRSVTTGEPVEKDILHIVTESGEIYTTESPTVIETFRTAYDFMQRVDLEYKLIRQKSKNGRLFMDLELLSLDDSEYEEG